MPKFKIFRKKKVLGVKELSDQICGLNNPFILNSNKLHFAENSGDFVDCEWFFLPTFLQKNENPPLNWNFHRIR